MLEVTTPAEEKLWVLILLVYTNIQSYTGRFDALLFDYIIRLQQRKEVYLLDNVHKRFLAQLMYLLWNWAEISMIVLQMHQEKQRAY